MKKRPVPGKIVPSSAEHASPVSGRREPDRERWLGASESRDGSVARRIDTIGSAHGPRILELLRAS